MQVMYAAYVVCVSTLFDIVLKARYALDSAGKIPNGTPRHAVFRGKEMRTTTTRPRNQSSSIATTAPPLKKIETSKGREYSSWCCC